MIWTWRNDPVSRANFGTEDRITWQAHEARFQSALSDPNKMIFIGQINSVPIGIIRFDLVVDGPVYEVSLSLAPEHCCKGLGAACKEGNGPVASGRVFQRCGFLEERVNGIFVTYSREASGRAQDS